MVRPEVDRVIATLEPAGGERLVALSPGASRFLGKSSGPGSLFEKVLRG